MANMKIPEDIRKDLESKGGLKKVIDSLPPEEEIKVFARRFATLSDIMRLKILCFLGRQSACVCLLREFLHAPYSKISYHLSLLKNASLIEGKRRGNYVIYSLTPEGEKVYHEICRGE